MKGAPAIPRRPVLAIATDGSDAAIVAHCTVVSPASDQEMPTLLLVPLPRAAFTTDPAIAARMYQRAWHEAQTLTTRARAVMGAAGFAVPTRVAWHATMEHGSLILPMGGKPSETPEKDRINAPHGFHEYDHKNPRH